MTFPNGLLHILKIISGINEGENELTAKITCLVREVVDGVVDMNSNGTSMSKWYTVNVTGSSSREVRHKTVFITPTEPESPS